MDLPGPNRPATKNGNIHVPNRCSLPVYVAWVSSSVMKYLHAARHGAHREMERSGERDAWIVSYPLDHLGTRCGGAVVQRGSEREHKRRAHKKKRTGLPWLHSRRFAAASQVHKPPVRFRVCSRKGSTDRVVTGAHGRKHLHESLPQVTGDAQVQHLQAQLAIACPATQAQGAHGKHRFQCRKQQPQSSLKQLEK